MTVTDMNNPLPNQTVARKMMNDVVANTQPADSSHPNVMSVGQYDLQLSGKNTQ